MRLLACFFLILILIAAAPLAAQDTACLRQMGDAIQSALESCVALGDNQVCYGGGSVQAIPHPGAADLGLREPGDRASLYNLQSLAVGGDAYSVALMKLHPDLGGSFHNQTISLVLYGSARVEPVDTVPARYTIGSANVRFGSQDAEIYTEPDANSPLAGLIFGTNQQNEGAVLGRSTDENWFYIAPDYCSMNGNDRYKVKVPECSSTGWVAGQSLHIQGDITVLPVSDSGVQLSSAHPSYSPLQRPSYAQFSGLMQNLLVQTGVSASSCSDTQSGILIQTHDIQAPLELMLNGVHLSINGTLQVEAAPDGIMIIRTLAGEVEISAPEDYAVGKPGTEFEFATGDDGIVLHGFQAAGLIDSSEWAALPLGLLRDYVVPIEQVDPHALIPYTGTLPQTGLYQITGDYTQSGCDNRWGGSRSLASEQVQVSVIDDWLNIEPLDRRGLLDFRNSMNRAGMYVSGTWLRVTEPDAKGGATRNPADGVFVTSGGYYNGSNGIRLSSATHIEGLRTFIPYAGCTQTWDYALDYVGPCVGLAEVSPGLQQCKNAP